MRYGFAREGARVATAAQQAAELATSCDQVLSGGDGELAALLGRLQPGDELEVLRIDCLATTVAGVRDALARLEAVPAGLISRAERLDTRDDHADLLRQIVNTMADIEASIRGPGRSS